MSQPDKKKQRHDETIDRVLQRDLERANAVNTVPVVAGVHIYYWLATISAHARREWAG